ncbi:BnaC09g21690D [Brassica napus]|uniref:BnaC09g21690D protein n=3 Tax=Brassica TaxID=3705 RepID=A0A078HL19_BRANA|nr:BnaC09g21690D [Brassica napus]
MDGHVSVLRIKKEKSLIRDILSSPLPHFPSIASQSFRRHQRTSLQLLFLPQISSCATNTSGGSILEKKKKVHDFIKRASSRLDPLSPFESFRRYTKNDLSVYLEPGRGDRLSSSLKQHIRKLLKVPILDSSSIKWVQPNTLVRFRGMIQDMLGNEFYAGAYKVPGQNQWTECSSVELKNRFLDLTGQKQGETCRVDEAGLNGSPSLSWTVSWSNSSEEATPRFSSARRPTISATLTPTTTLKYDKDTCMCIVCYDDVYLLLLLLGCQRYLNMITLDCNVGSRTKPMD